MADASAALASLQGILGDSATQEECRALLQSVPNNDVQAALNAFYDRPKASDRDEEPAAAAMAADSDDESAPGDGVASLLAKANELKGEGNEAFKAGDYGKATTIYADAIGRLTSTAAKKALKEWWESSAQEDTASPLLVTLHTNRAACHVKLEQWEGAVLSASKALEIDGSSTKARFRRGVACSHLGRMEEAKADLTAVARADPKNREAHAAPPSPPLL